MRLTVPIFPHPLWMNPAPEFWSAGVWRKARPLLYLMLSVLGAIAGLWGVETLRQQDPFARFTRRLAQSGLQEIELLLERPQITLRAGARAVATLEVDRIVVDRARITWRAENLRRAVFYDEQGKPIAQARAGAILYNQPARRIHLQGQPEFVYLRAPLVEKPVRVRMAWLTWDLRLRQLSIPARMQFEWEGGTGSAEQFVWDLARGETSLSNGVFRFRVALPDSPQQTREIEVRFKQARGTGEAQIGTSLTFRDQDAHAAADKAEVYDRKKYILATGALFFEDPRVRIEGEKMEIWYDSQKRALLHGKVRMRIKPQKTEPPAEEETEAEKAKRYPIDAECDGGIEYFYRKKIAYLRGGIKATQQIEGRTRTLTADSAEYDQKNERLILRGNVVLDDPERFRITTHLLIVSTKEGSDEFEMPEGGSGVIYYTEEEEESRPENPPSR
ncbi:MAG: hypothetical protein N2045_11715 [Fimbriimonadales bacterium]|nr:hypothetical protein [Fimbriimonadales bacterium]